MARPRSAAPTWRDVAAVDGDGAGGRAVEAGDEAQERGLAAAGGADEDHELAVLDVERDVADDLGVAEGLGDVREGDAGHQSGPAAGRQRSERLCAPGVVLPGLRRGPCAPVGARFPHPPSPRPEGRGNLPDREGKGACGDRGWSMVT